MPLVSAVGLAKTYRVGDVDVPALRGVDFTIETGAFVAFVGPSGSGKSTLLNMIGCLDRPSSGRLTVLDTDVATLDRRAAGGLSERNHPVLRARGNAARAFPHVGQLPLV